MINPLLLIRIGAVLLAISLVFLMGVRWEKSNTQELIVQYKDEIIKLKNEQLSEINNTMYHLNNVSTQLETDLALLNTREKLVVKEVIKEIEKPIYSQCLITPEALKNHESTVNQLNKSLK